MDDFYMLLSDLLQQTAQNPEAPPTLPLERWPAESQERRVLEGLQAVLGTMHTSNPNHPSRAKRGEQRYQTIFKAASDGLIIIDLETGLVMEANPAACTMYGYAHQEFIGLPSTCLIHPEHLEQFARYIQSLPTQGVIQQIHTRRDGTQFYVELSGTAYLDQGHSVLMCVVRDVSQRVQAEQLLHQQVALHTREQATLLKISQTLASALELQPGMILDQLRVIIDFTHAGLFKLEDTSLVALAFLGPQALEQIMPFTILLENPDTLAAMFNGERYSRIANVQSADPPAKFLRSLLVNRASILLEDAKSWMWVPLIIKERVIGAIGVAHDEPNFFTAHHADLALTVANQAAITMVNAELYEHAQALAALQERQSLARNLHDAVNQSLFSAGLIAEVLPRLWERNADEGLQSLDDLRRLMRGAQADMRLLLAELRPSTLTDAELGDLLRLLANALAGRTNIPIEVSIIGEGMLPADVQVALYRLCQEGLSNIAKHAGASQVDIQLQYENDAVELRIRDDGRGFDPTQTPPGHYGLGMMRERATGIGATLSISSQPGQGTEIMIGWGATQEQKDG